MYQVRSQHGVSPAGVEAGLPTRCFPSGRCQRMRPGPDGVRLGTPPLSPQMALPHPEQALLDGLGAPAACA